MKKIYSFTAVIALSILNLYPAFADRLEEETRLRLIGRTKYIANVPEPEVAAPKASSSPSTSIQNAPQTASSGTVRGAGSNKTR